jgi:transcriptional regulator with XRE-family HTH domain
MSTAIAARVKMLADQLALTQNELGDLLNTSQRTVSRWAAGTSTPPPDPKQQLLELAYLGEQLAKVMKPDEANVWVSSPNRLLNGESPAQLIRRREFRKVLGLIQALGEGVIV